MAQYENPFGRYTRGQSFAIFQGGFESGLGMRRNLEETAKLIREREDYEQSQKLMGQINEENKELQSQIIQKRDKLINLLNKQEAGQIVDHTQIDLLLTEFNQASTQSLLLKRSAADRLMGSGLNTAAKWGQDMAASGIAESAQVNEVMTRTQERMAADKRASQQRQLERDLSADQLGFKERELEQRGELAADENQLRRDLSAEDNALRASEGAAERELRRSEGALDRKAAMDQIRAKVRLEIKSRQSDPLYMLKLEQATIEGIAAGVPMDAMNQIRGELGMPPLKEGAQSTILDPEIKAKIDSLTKAAEVETDPDLKQQMMEEVGALQKEYKDRLRLDLQASTERRKNKDWWKGKVAIAREAAKEAARIGGRVTNFTGGPLPGMPGLDPVGALGELKDQLEDPFYDMAREDIEDLSKMTPEEREEYRQDAENPLRWRQKRNPGVGTYEDILKNRK